MASLGTRFFARTSAGSIPSFAARRSMMRSIANTASGLPAPRYAVVKLVCVSTPFTPIEAFGTS